MAPQQVLQREWNWFYVLTPVWHGERRGSDWAVCYCKLADRHRFIIFFLCSPWTHWLFLFRLCSVSKWNCSTTRPLIKPSLSIRNQLQIAQWCDSAAPHWFLVHSNHLKMTVNRVTHHTVQLRMATHSYLLMCDVFRWSKNDSRGDVAQITAAQSEEYLLENTWPPNSGSCFSERGRPAECKILPEATSLQTAEHSPEGSSV